MRRSSPVIPTAAIVPPATAAQVWIDFDGTITHRDVLDDLIVGFAIEDSWKQVEADWQAGLIGSRQCLEHEFGLLHLTDAQLAGFLDRVTVDPAMKSLIRLLRVHRVPAAILSDGVEQFITHILQRHALNDFPVRSNRIEREGCRMKLVCPFSSAACTTAAAHCKCGSIQAAGQVRRKSIYIGDGRSDLCPARKADLVFAKGVLARELSREGRMFVPFIGLSDVVAVLQSAWS